MKGKALGILLGLVFLALVANLAVELKVVPKPEGVGRVRPWLFFIVVAAANAAVAIAGLVFAVRAWFRREKSSLRFGALGFVAVLVFLLGLVSSPWWLLMERERSGVLVDLTFAMLGFAVPIALFAAAFWREYVRAVGTAPRSRTHRFRPGAHATAEETGAER